jgi:hypothetical protein
MVRALSKAVQNQKIQKKKDVKMERTLEDYRQNALKAKEIQVSLRVLAERNGVDKETLRRRANGRQGITEMNVKKQWLTPNEERVVLDHILMSADRGFPMKPRAVVLSANEILKSRGAETIDPESNWVHRFLNRHRDELQMHWSKPLDSQPCCP